MRRVARLKEYLDKIYVMSNYFVLVSNIRKSDDAPEGPE
jgi:hypothetical protein